MHISALVEIAADSGKAGTESSSAAMPSTKHNQRMKKSMFASGFPSARNAALALTTLACCMAVHAEKIGDVSTAFQWIGPNHKVAVEAYDDPKVGGITCYVSRARTGGVKGAFGLAEDRAEASIACRQVGALAFSKELPEQEEVFSERMSILFKRMRVVRMVDSARNTLIYLSYSDKLIDGSPQNSVTAVPVSRDMPIPVKK